MAYRVNTSTSAARAAVGAMKSVGGDVKEGRKFIALDNAGPGQAVRPGYKNVLIVCDMHRAEGDEGRALYDSLGEAVETGCVLMGEVPEAYLTRAQFEDGDAVKDAKRFIPAGLMNGQFISLMNANMLMRDVSRGGNVVPGPEYEHMVRGFAEFHQHSVGQFLNQGRASSGGGSAAVGGPSNGAGAEPLSDKMSARLTDLNKTRDAYAEGQKAVEALKHNTNDVQGAERLDDLAGSSYWALMVDLATSQDMQREPLMLMQASTMIASITSAHPAKFTVGHQRITNPSWSTCMRAYVENVQQAAKAANDAHAALSVGDTEGHRTITQEGLAAVSKAINKCLADLTEAEGRAAKTHAALNPAQAGGIRERRPTRPDRGNGADDPAGKRKSEHEAFLERRLKRQEREKANGEHKGPGGKDKDKE
jgi:hypothetical protein